MGARPLPTQLLAAKERTAARLLDMDVAEFRRLVSAGALPGPARFDRWEVEELRRIMRGDPTRVDDELDL